MQGTEGLVERVAGRTTVRGAAAVGGGQAGRGAVVLAVVRDSVCAEEILEFPVLVDDSNFLLDGAGISFFELHYLFFKRFDVDLFAFAVGSEQRVSLILRCVGASSNHL